MIRFMSDTNTPSDIKNGRMRVQVSLTSPLENPSDADIRNKVEGYRTETEVLAEAECSFLEWSQTLDPLQRLTLYDGALWHAYRAGWLSMARELGQLPWMGAS